MEPLKIEWIGSPCGSHGPCTFYRAFSLPEPGSSGQGKAPRTLTARLGQFLFVRCQPHEPECIAELQLLWEDRSRQQLLASTRLYFSPEDTPQGRNLHHGQDEVIAVSKKVIIRLQDLAKWVCTKTSQWATNAQESKPDTMNLDSSEDNEDSELHASPPSDCHLTSNVGNECEHSGYKDDLPQVKILSYPQYCRYRAIRKRIQKASARCVDEAQLLALGGILLMNQNTKILYCRETFEHPTLGNNMSICDEFAPRVLTRTSAGRVVRTRLQITARPQSLTLLHYQLTGATDLKGRSRKKKPRITKGDESPSRESRQPSQSDAKEEKDKVESENMAAGNGQAYQPDNPSELLSAEQHFLKALHSFMCDRNTPIARIPHLGFKKIDLFVMFTVTQRLGGYDAVTARRLWKHIYDELGGNPGSTSAATCTRRHYERLILPYERYLKGEEHKPLPPAKPRKHTTSTSEDSEKDVKTKNGELNVKVKKGPDVTQMFEKEDKQPSGEKCQENRQRTITAQHLNTQDNSQDKQMQTLKCKREDNVASNVEECSGSKTCPPTGQNASEKPEAKTFRIHEHKIKHQENRECPNVGKKQKSPLHPQDLSGGPSVKQNLHVGTEGSKPIFQSAVFQHLPSGILNFQLPEGISPLDVLKSRLGLATSKDLSKPTLHRHLKAEQSQGIASNGQKIKVCTTSLREPGVQRVAGLVQKESKGVPQPAKRLSFEQLNGIRPVKGNSSTPPSINNSSTVKHSKAEHELNLRPLGLRVGNGSGALLGHPMKLGLVEEGLNLSKSKDCSYIYDPNGQLYEILPQNLSNKQLPPKCEPSIRYREQSSPLNLSKSNKGSSGKRISEFMDASVCVSQKGTSVYPIPPFLQNLCENRESHKKNEQPIKKLRLDSCYTEGIGQGRDSTHSDHSSGVESLSSSPLSLGSGVTSDDMPTDLSLPKYPKTQKPDHSAINNESPQDKRAGSDSEAKGKHLTDPPKLPSFPAVSEATTPLDGIWTAPAKSDLHVPSGTSVNLDQAKSCQDESPNNTERRQFSFSSMVPAEQSCPPARLEEPRKENEEPPRKKPLMSNLAKVGHDKKPLKYQESDLSNHQDLSSSGDEDNKKGALPGSYLNGTSCPDLQNVAEKFGAHFQLVDLNKNAEEEGKSDSVVVPVLSSGLPVSRVMVPGPVQHRQLLSSHSQQMYSHLLRTSVLPYDEVVMRRLSSSPSALSPSHLSTVYPEKRM
ncbi:AT-rich interactive domain-containing protein 5B-like isoform X2 [Hypanus sabinus]|uniref:AT-rich interactive domain-containing protein 5B-like isoform X2 n=1 Tax=Hypanus sabinus TaxID=79690 RepID=UPI0028C3C28D|nr:AT-rich interactive domain-containing protein 5B-like isoform X2 [Hypanus sabinus]